MGFAQKLGEFAGGFSEGLLPGVQVGTDIAESKSRRAAANTREQRLESGAQKAMLWKMFEYDPAGAMAKAESLGYSELATSFRRNTKGAIGAKYAAVGAGMNKVPTVGQITDFSLPGLRAQAEAYRSNLDTRRAASGAVDTTRASVPEELRGLVSTDNLSAQRAVFDEGTARLENTLTSTELLISSIGKLNYNREDYLTNIDEATNAYIQATGNSEVGNALKSELLKSARESQRATWMPVIDSLKGDAEGLNDLLANRIILESPILSTMVASLISKAEREQDLSPEQKRIREEARASAKVLEGLAKNTAITNPEAAAEYYDQSLAILTENQLENPETLAILKENAKHFLDSSVQRSRQEIATSIFSDITDSYLPPEVMLGKYGKLFNIDIPVGIKIDTEEGQRIFSNLIDAIQGATLQTQEPEAKTDPADLIISDLNKGNAAQRTIEFNKYLAQFEDPIRRNIVLRGLQEKFKAAGWQWVDNPAGLGAGPGSFEQFEAPTQLPVQRKDTQMPTRQGQKSASPSSTAVNSPTNATVPFLPQQ